MAQISKRSKEAATFVGRESAFATLPGTMYRAFPVENSFGTELEQKEIENVDERTTLYAVLPTVRGLQDGKLKLEFYGKVHSSQLIAGASPSPNYMTEVLDAAWGYTGAGEGSLVTAGSTTTVVNVSTGDGSNFEVGQWIGIEAGATNTLEPCRIVSIATDALTVYPPMSTAPLAGDIVVNSVTVAPSVTHDGTLYVQHAMVGDSSMQWSLKGNTANIGFEVKRNEIFKLMVEGAVGSFVGPENQSISTAVDSDTLTSPFVVRDALVLFRASGTSVANRTAYPLAEFSVKTNGKMEHIAELGGTEGKLGAFRKGQRLFAEATLKFRYDGSIDSSTWSAQTAMQCVVIVPKGSGTSKRFIAIDLPYTYIVGKPKIVNEDGMVYFEITLHASEDSSIASPTTDLMSAPMRLAFI